MGISQKEEAQKRAYKRTDEKWEAMVTQHWKAKTEAKILNLLSDGKVWTEREIAEALHPGSSYPAVPLSRLENLQYEGRVKLTLPPTQGTYLIQLS